MFERSEENIDYGISPQELMNSKLIPDTNKQTYQEIQRNKGDIQLISINGIILATDLGKAGTKTIPIFDQITTPMTLNNWEDGGAAIGNVCRHASRTSRLSRTSANKQLI